MAAREVGWFGPPPIPPTSPVLRRRREITTAVAGRRAWFAGTAVDEGDWLSIDGEAGTVYRGRGRITIERPEAALAEIARWQAEAVEIDN